jgi:hypothetical protein
MSSSTPNSNSIKRKRGATEEQSIDTTSTVDARHGAEIIEEIDDSRALTQEVTANKKKRSQIQEDKRRKFVLDAFEEVPSFP